MHRGRRGRGVVHSILRTGNEEAVVPWHINGTREG